MCCQLDKLQIKLSNLLLSWYKIYLQTICILYYLVIKKRDTHKSTRVAFEHLQALPIIFRPNAGGMITYVPDPEARRRLSKFMFVAINKHFFAEAYHFMSRICTKDLMMREQNYLSVHLI